MAAAIGGTIEMYKMLGQGRQVGLWSRFTPAQEFSRHYPIRLIRPWLGRFPIGGTFIFVGAYFRIGHWFQGRAADADDPDLQHVPAGTGCRKPCGDCEPGIGGRWKSFTRRGCCARLLASRERWIESPIDIVQFTPPHERAPGPFRVGRLSRDIASKHHDEDPSIYAALGAQGVEVRIMGGTCLRARPEGLAETVLLPAGAMPACTFLQGLDCFFYRTSERWLEAYGRVVFEAMACGLPVVCGRRGGYADYIVHGINGFLFDTTAEAIALIRSLRDDAALRERVGRAARATVERLYARYRVAAEAGLFPGVAAGSGCTAGRLRRLRSVAVGIALVDRPAVAGPRSGWRRYTTRTEILGRPSMWALP